MKQEFGPISKKRELLDLKKVFRDTIQGWQKRRILQTQDKKEILTMEKVLQKDWWTPTLIKRYCKIVVNVVNSKIGVTNKGNTTFYLNLWYFNISHLDSSVAKHLPRRISDVRQTPRSFLRPMPSSTF